MSNDLYIGALLQEVENNEDAIYPASLSDVRDELSGYEDELEAIDKALSKKK